MLLKEGNWKSQLNVWQTSNTFGRGWSSAELKTAHSFPSISRLQNFESTRPTLLRWSRFQPDSSGPNSSDLTCRMTHIMNISKKFWKSKKFWISKNFWISEDVDTCFPTSFKHQLSSGVWMKLVFKWSWCLNEVGRQELTSSQALGSPETVTVVGLTVDLNVFLWFLGV